MTPATESNTLSTSCRRAATTLALGVISALALTPTSAHANAPTCSENYWNGSAGHGTITKISRQEILNRAKSWLNSEVIRCPNHSHTNQHGTYRQDCSGYVSMALGLSASSTSYNLPALGTELSDFKKLRPGDYVARNGHVRLFVRWDGGTPVFWENYSTYKPTREMTTTVAQLKTAGYKPYRYKHVVDNELKGHFDTASIVGSRDLRVTGWAVQSAKAAANTMVEVRVNEAKHNRATGRVRGDVVAALQLPGSARPGFDEKIPLPGPGRYRVCVTARAGGTSKSLGCKNVTRVAKTLAAGLRYQPITPKRVRDVTINAGQTLTFDLSNTKTVKGVSATLTAVAPSANGYLKAWQCGRAPETSSLNYQSGAATATHAIVPLDGAGKMCVYSSKKTRLLVDVNGWMRSDLGYRFNPKAVRLADTRKGHLGGRLSAGEKVVVQLAGRGGIPSKKPKAAALNVTVVNPKSAGHLTVWDCASKKPVASSLNHRPGQITSATINTKLSGSGKLCIYSHSATDLLVDVQGWYGATGRTYRAIEPTRLVDTRSSNPTRTAGRNGKKLPARGKVKYDVGGAVGIPKGAAAVFKTATLGHSGSGFLTTWNCASKRPGVSHLNYSTAPVNSNSGQVAVNGAGELCTYSHASTHLVVDIAGMWQ